MDYDTLPYQQQRHHPVSEFSATAHRSVKKHLHRKHTDERSIHSAMQVHNQ